MRLDYRSRYGPLVRDGDAKGYMDIADTYVSIGQPVVQSNLDINHVLKNIRKRIHKLRSTERIQINGVSQKISGLGRVTEEYGDSVLKYLSQAVRCNVDPNGDVEPMKNAILAVREHKSSTDCAPNHE